MARRDNSVMSSHVTGETPTERYNDVLYSGFLLWILPYPYDILCIKKQHVF